MSITNSGMTLYTNNDNESGWSGTDGSDAYNNAIQGTNSESWQVSKNSTETGTLTKTANMSSAKYFTFYMSSNLAPYYTSLKLNIRTDTSNYEQWTLATSSNRKVSGDFHPIVAQFGQGTETGTLNKSSIGSLQLILDNSSSGNIRSVINNWIDAMWYGTGRTISGTTTSDELFLESHTSDTTTNDRYDGCSELYKGALAYQTDVTIDTTTGNSYGEVVNFAGGYDTDSSYTLSVTGTTDWQGTTIQGVDNAKVSVDTTSATSFSMTGGGISNGGTIDFGSSQTVDGVVLTSCDRIKTSSVLKNTVISDTTETTTGAYEMQTSSELSDTNTGIRVNNYNGKYALYIPASITGTISISGFTCDSSGTDVYWAATSGTLTINASNGTNLSTSAAGGTASVSIQNAVSLTITVKDEAGQGINAAHIIMQRQDTKATIISGTTNSSGVYSESINYTGDIDFVGWARQWDLTGDDYIPKDFSGTITSNGASVNVTLDKL